MQTKPLLVVLTGINGAGKDTLAPLVADWLDGQAGYPAEFIYAPKVTPASTAFRQAVLDGKPQSPLAETLGYFAQHAESDTHLASLRHTSPRHLVINRGPETTLVYNAIANRLEGEALALAYSAYEVIEQILDPTIVILLEIDLATSRARSAQQAETDHIQERDNAYYRRMIDAYAHLKSTRPNWVGVDAMVGVSGVFKQIKDRLRPFLS